MTLPLQYGGSSSGFSVRDVQKSLLRSVKASELSPTAPPHTGTNPTELMNINEGVLAIAP